MSFIIIIFLITKILSWESIFSIKHTTNSVGVYKRPDFGFVNENDLSTFSIFIMDEAFLCRCFLFLFDVVFLFFESSLSRNILQLNLVLFNALFPHWVFLRLKLSSCWTLYLLHRIFAYDVKWLDADIYISVVILFKFLSERRISLFVRRQQLNLS